MPSLKAIYFENPICSLLVRQFYKITHFENVYEFESTMKFNVHSNYSFIQMSIFKRDEKYIFCKNKKQSSHDPMSTFYERPLQTLLFLTDFKKGGGSQID